MILGVVVQYVDGNQRIIHVSELVNDNEDFIISGEDENSLICCVYGNCSCSSLDHALANLTSNVLINITTDVTLSSLVRVSDLENVSIIGHNNPTVNCRSIGGIHFTYCNNCIVQGITWDGCGAGNISNDTEPGLKLSYSSNVTIQSCFFQQSVGQAVVLSEMLGDVSINNCMFMNNSHYRGHGAAVHYSSSTNNDTINYSLEIKNCNFSYNNIKSLVYLENENKCDEMILNNSTFIDNQGISVYAINHKIYLNGKVSFKNNTAENGAGVYISDHSTVTFVNNSEAVFLRNHSSIICDQNSAVHFISNDATNGIVYADTSSNVTFKGNCHVTFSDNSATQWGAAIYSDNSLVTFMGNSKVTFSSNYISTRSYYSYGGVIYSINFSNISFKGSSTTLFNKNTATDGGAIYSSDYGSISFEENSNTTFSNNYAAYEGGAIYYKNSGIISFKGNASTMFSSNTADYYGGAIELFRHVNMFFGENSATTFIDNNSKYGGAIDCYYNCSILHEGNSSTMFNNNAADYGGAVYSYSSNIAFEGISATVYSNNTAAANGGAIYHRSWRRSTSITFEGISTVVFSDNMANLDGGAVFSFGDISFNGNSCTEFRDNTADNNGGAIAMFHANLTFNNNSTVTFANNNATFNATIFSIGESNKITEIRNPTIIFNDHIVNWCINTCLPYPDTQDHRDVAITIDNNGTIRCSNEQEALVSFSRKCGFNYLEDILVNLTSNGLATISGRVLIFSVISLTKLYNVSIIGSKNHNITCVNNYNAGLQVKHCSNITIEGLNWVGCGADTTPVIHISNSSNVTLQNCLFQQSKGQAVVIFESLGHMNFNHCKFINNTEYSGHGAAIHYSSNDVINSQLTLLISNCNFSYNEGATSLLYINGQTEDTNISLCNSSFHNNHGISIYLSSNTLHISGEALFENNVAKNGAGIYINKFSKVMFDDFSNVTFINNFVNHSGAAIFLKNYSSVLFDQSSVVTFNNNNASIGIIYSDASSNVTFKATCNVTFNGNLAKQYGAAIYSSDNSHVTFTGNSNIMFNNNINALDEFINHGGTAVYCENNSSLIFEDNSTVVFHNNTGNNGGAILSQCNSVIIFKDNSTVMFNNNKAHNSGGALFADSGTVTIKDNSTVTFNGNKASLNGGAVHFEHAAYNFSSNIVSIFEFANVTFKNNMAHQYGGAVYCGYHQIFMFGGNATVTFSGNNAKDGGAFYAFNMSKIIFNSSAFSNNVVINGGTKFSFTGMSNATFNNNTAENGGTFYLTNSATLIFNDNVTITLKNNSARKKGGVIYSMNSFVLFNGSSNVSLVNNKATLNGGVIYCDSNSDISFAGSTNVSFNKSSADNGGVLFANNSKISFKNASLTFIKNKARSNGGAGYFNGLCNVTFEQNANVTFENNNALYGGAICLNSNTTITFNDNSTVLFNNNIATNDGGAINIVRNSSIIVNGNTTINFTANNAQYGGAMFFDATHTTLSFNKNERKITFNLNTARIAGSNMYFDSIGPNNSCLQNRITDISNKTKHLITTPPSKIKFYTPATCIKNHSKTGECSTYHLKPIMLGEEINIPVYVSNYCDQPSYPTQFLLQGGNNLSYFISGSNHTLLSGNDTFQGISIIGNNRLSKSSNYTINITLHDDRNSNWKQVSVNLTVELTPCYPGFWQDSGSVKCECYNAKDILFCSGSNSMIKRGYWFGKVAEQPTVAICPVNYCDFTCCEASNGYYHLSLVRDNQCRSHRFGIACSSCTDGYTLSFDSPECLNADSCTAGQTILVILLTVTYWIVMVALVFAMMYYKVPIGYLYSITYYYSIVDILLSENLHASRGLLLTVSIMSSFSKITPQFLGELCLTTGMSGIDQYFIHYVHPTAVILILTMISLSARSSRRISAFISRGIIHVICLLLLLSYTSIASTSLLLMRPLKFHGIDKIYTYLSPDIEYFHGRHLAYGIVALLCTIIIV